MSAEIALSVYSQLQNITALSGDSTSISLLITILNAVINVQLTKAVIGMPL